MGQRKIKGAPYNWVNTVRYGFWMWMKCANSNQKVILTLSQDWQFIIRSVILKVSNRPNSEVPFRKLIEIEKILAAFPWPDSNFGPPGWFPYDPRRSTDWATPISQKLKAKSQYLSSIENNSALSSARQRERICLPCPEQSTRPPTCFIIGF